MKKTWLLYLIFLVTISAISCAAGPNYAVHTADSNGNIAGFWLGLWHGAIPMVTFFISLFSDKVHIYETHNNGGWYNFGFLFGATGLISLVRLLIIKPLEVLIKLLGEK